MVLARAATSRDELGVAHVHVRLWRIGYQDLSQTTFRSEEGKGPSGAGYLREESCVFPAEHRGRRRNGQPRSRNIRESRNFEFSGEGEIFAVSVDPDHWG